MSKKFKPFSKNKLAVIEAVKNYDKIWKEQRSLNESITINNSKYCRLKGLLTECAEPKNWPQGYLAVRRRPKIYLFESSVHSQPTLGTVDVLEKVQKTCPEITHDNIMLVINDASKQTIADAVGFIFSDPIPNNINEIATEVDKIMTVCGYFVSIEPGYRFNPQIGKREYVLQYEPNFPEKIISGLPPFLHHVTTIHNSEKILTEGFIPQTNDIFKYYPRVYFIEDIDNYTVSHLVRRHKEELLDSVTHQKVFADIIINTPPDQDFYYDPHMLSGNSYFVTEPIDKKYITEVKRYVITINPTNMFFDFKLLK